MIRFLRTRYLFGVCNDRLDVFLVSLRRCHVLKKDRLNIFLVFVFVVLKSVTMQWPKLLGGSAVGSGNGHFGFIAAVIVTRPRYCCARACQTSDLPKTKCKRKKNIENLKIIIIKQKTSVMWKCEKETIAQLQTSRIRLLLIGNFYLSL